VGENHRDGAGLIELGDLFWGQLQLRRGEVLFELSQSTRSDDRQRALRRDPGHGHLTRAHARFLGNCLDRVENGGALRGVLGLKHPATESFSSARLALAILAGQHTAAERRPGDNAEAQRVAGRQHAVFRGAFCSGEKSVRRV